MDLKTQCLWKSKYWVMDGTTFELWTVWNSLHPCCYLCRLLEHLCRMLCNFQKNQIFTVTQHNQGFALAEWHLIFSLTIFFTEMQKSIYLPFTFTGWLKSCTLLQSRWNRTFSEICLSVTRTSVKEYFWFWLKWIYFGEKLPKISV